MVEREQRRVVRRGDLEEEINLCRDRHRPQEMIRAPQQTGFKRVAATDGVHFIGKAGRLGRLVDDPGNAAGPCQNRRRRCGATGQPLTG